MSKDMKKCIRDFIHHVDELEAQEDPEGNGFNMEYRLIQEKQIRDRRENVFSMDEGRADNNLRKNRYKDIIPYDDHRVKLLEVEGEENSDYINASKLVGVNGTGGYIASQGPLASTVNDFWRMIWECNAEIIFMACRIVELGKIKCKQYWHDLGESDEFGDITVFTETEEAVSTDCTLRKFRVKRGDEERSVIQFHYSGWPDHGIPEDPAHIRDLIGIMRQMRKNDKAPLVVHCSAGCGRTGAIIAIDYVWTLLEEGKFDEDFSLSDQICTFREQRMSIVQTADQYALVYKVLKALCEEWLKKMASHVYVNVELNQDESTSADNDSGNKSTAVDNIYEDSVSVGQMMEEGKQAPQLPSRGNVTEDRLLGNSARRPEVIELPQPTQAQTSSSYENIALLSEKDQVPQEKAPAPPVPTDSNEKPKHKTVIQIGASSPSSHHPPTSGPGGQKEVVNYVRSASSTSSASPASSPITPSGKPPPTFTAPPPPGTAPPTIRPAPPPPQQQQQGNGPPPSLPPPLLPYVQGKALLPPSHPAPLLPQAQGKQPAPAAHPTPHLPPPGKAAPPPPSHPAPQPAPQALPTRSQAPPQPVDAIYTEVIKKPGKTAGSTPNQQVLSPTAKVFDNSLLYGGVESHGQSQPAVIKVSAEPIPHQGGRGDAPVSPIRTKRLSDPYSLVGDCQVQESVSSPDNSPYEQISPHRANSKYKGFVRLSGNPGFSERLPRVKGPVPMPQSWEKS